MLDAVGRHFGERMPKGLQSTRSHRHKPLNAKKLLGREGLEPSTFRVNILLGMISKAAVVLCPGPGQTGSLDAAQGRPVVATVSIPRSGVLFKEWVKELAFPHQANG